ncbi:hypothetical protein DFH09DRAFT_1104331 [Mycena vulgaris]|nr:hypothetical protein DFH09DRAFT_1104331 [Mycena vulgaris]
MRAVHEWERKQEILSATAKSELDALGLLEVLEDMLIFARELGSTDAREDALQACLTPARLVPAEARENLRQAANATMGPLEEITLEPPVHAADGSWIAGQARYPLLHIASSHKSQKGIWVPAQASKINGSFDKNNLMHHNLNIQMPEKTCKDVEDYTSMLNIPALDLPGNTAHNTLQLNVAPAVPYGSEKTLANALGFYGGNHNDNKDSPAWFTNMAMCLRLPNDYTLSKFHILRFGLYFTLRNFDSANFCGLKYHGGTPPIAPEGVTVAQDAYHMTFISYPPEKMGDGLGHIGVGALPTAKDPVLKMSAEMQHVDCESRVDRVAVTQANFAADGQVVMDVRAHLPLSYDFRIDSDHFLSSFSFSPDGETRESIESWAKGPGFRPSAASDSSPAPEPSHDSSSLLLQEAVQSEIKRRWRLHYNRFLRHIPYAVVHDKHFEISADGSLLIPPTLVEARVEALGNPIESAGRPYSKPTPPETAATRQGRPWQRRSSPPPNLRSSPLVHTFSSHCDPTNSDLHLLPDQGAEDSNSDAPTRKRCRAAQPAIMSSSDESSSSCNSSSVVRKSPVKVYRSSAKRREDSQGAAEDAMTIWKSEQFVQINNQVVARGSTRVRELSTTMAGASQDRALIIVKMDEVDEEMDIDLEPDPVELFFQDAGGIKLLDCLALATITRDHSSVQDAYHLTQHSGDIVTQGDYPLNAAFQGMQSAPGSVETSVSISRIWPQFESLPIGEANTVLVLKLRRQSVMQTTLLVWTWLDVYCVTIICSAFREASPTTWIGRLAKHVHILISTRAEAHELRPSEFGLDQLAGVYTFRQRKSLDLNLPERLVIAVVIDIIALWLHFPTKSSSRAQAWFVETMAHECHPATLFLNSVWFAFGHLETEVFGDRHAKITTPAAYAPLATALEQCPLADTTSQEFLLMTDMQAMLYEYQTPPPHVTEDSRQLQFMNLFLDSLLELEPLIDSYQNIAEPTVFQATVNGQKDFLLPFREHGPSRIRSRLPGNSFDPLHSCTQGRLLSGLIFRAVIFSTPFALQAQTLFTTPAQWDAEYSKHGIHLVEEYWVTINTPDCPDWEENTRSGEYSFIDCFKFIKAANPSRFKEIGDLIGFLLTADFVYAGAVQSPSVSTVGGIIRDINAGGMKGLEILELIAPREPGLRSGFKKGDVADTRAGFSRLYKFLGTKLSAASKSHMVFDPIMVENSLCKMTQWVALKLVLFVLRNV